MQFFDIRLGAEVLKIIVPSLPPSSSNELSEDVPAFFSKKILVAVTCADYIVRLISLPLPPPSHSAKAQQHIGAQILSIGGPLQHQENINCTALTWTSYEDEGDEDSEDVEAKVNTDQARSKHSSSHGAQTDTRRRPQWRFLIASHSMQYFGTLLIHSVPLIPDKDGEVLPNGPIQPLRNQYLRYPLSSMVFSTSHTYSNSPVHLLTLDQKGSVKIYDPFASPAAVIQSRSRRKDDDQPSGAWLTSFATGFDTARSSSSNPDITYRKKIVDAQWILNSRAIIVLLSNGEWGIWCIRDTSAGSQPLVKGGSTTPFTMHGYLNSSEESDSRSSARSRGLAPATPNTRKTRTADFLSGSSAKAHVIRGGIHVVPLSVSDTEFDERLLMWYGNHIYAVPRFRTYWQRNAPSQAEATPSYGSSFPKIEDLELHGERCNGIEQLPGPGIPPTGLPELLIAGEYYLTFITKEPQSSQPTLSQALVPTTRDIVMDDADQTLLEREELDLGGVNRLLDGLEGNLSEQRIVRRVGFAR